MRHHEPFKRMGEKILVAKVGGGKKTHNILNYQIESVKLIVLGMCI